MDWRAVVAVVVGGGHAGGEEGVGRWRRWGRWGYGSNRRVVVGA